MNVEFKDERPAAETKQNIVIHGEIVGFMKSYHRTGDGELLYHCGFDGVGRTNALIQGHGDTREAAMASAIEAGKEHALAMLDGIEVLEIKLGTNSK